MPIDHLGERSEPAGYERVAAFVRNERWEAIVAAISRKFVNMDGLVVSLSRETFGGFLGYIGALAGEPIKGFWFFF